MKTYIHSVNVCTRRFYSYISFVGTSSRSDYIYLFDYNKQAPTIGFLKINLEQA